MSETKETAVEDIPKVSVVIPALNEQDHIARCLESLQNQVYPNNNYEIILVDNGSGDETVRIAAGFNVRVLSITGVKVGAVRNYGVEHADGEILAFIDADCVADNDWLSEGVRLLSNSSETIAIGGGCKLSRNAVWLERYWLLENNGKPALPKHLIGANILLSRKTFSKVKGFNENVTSGEDTEFSLNLNRNDIKVMMFHEINVTHLGNATTIQAFLKRQIWHSENYIQKLSSSIVDPVFVLTLLYLISSIVLVSCLVTDCRYWMVATLFIILIPVIFTAKRLKRAQLIPASPVKLLIIYFVDVLYLIGRAAGLLKSLYLKIISFFGIATTNLSR